MAISQIITKFFLIFTLLFCAASNAEIQRLGQNYFVAGILTDQFEFFSSPNQHGRQRQANWCWAASVQMVLNYHGLYVAQEQVVQRIYGAQVDSPADSRQILQALTGWAPDARGRYSSIHANPYTHSAGQIVQDLANRWPLIVGLRNPNGGIGHAVVLTAVFYSVDQFNNPILDAVVIRDPWPGNPSRQKISFNEFQSRLMFMTHIYVNRL